LSEKDFIDFIDENQGIVHKICRIYTNNQDDYDDLFQEILMQLWQSIGRYKGTAKLTTWMYRVGLFTATTRIKKEKRITYVDAPSHQEPQYIEYNRFEEEEKLLASIQKLNEADKGLVMLYLDERSYKEISEIMGISESNVGVRLNRIKSRLKTILTKQL